MSEQQQRQEREWTEELKVQGEALLGTVKGLAHEGNVRRIIIKDAQGKTLIEIPLTVGVVGALVAPVAAAVGAVAAMATDCSIVVERREDSPADVIAAPPPPGSRDAPPRGGERGTRTRQDQPTSASTTTK